MADKKYIYDSKNNKYLEVTDANKDKVKAAYESDKERYKLYTTPDGDVKKNKSQKQQQPQNEAITEGLQTVAEPLQESGGNDVAVQDLSESGFNQNEIDYTRAGVEKSFAPNPLRNIVKNEFSDQNKERYAQRKKQIDQELNVIQEEAKALGLEIEQFNEKSKRLNDFVFKLPTKISENAYKIQTPEGEQVISGDSLTEYNQRVDLLKQEQEQINTQIKTKEQELSDRYTELAKEKYTTGLAEMQYETAQKEEVRNAVIDFWDSLPITFSVGARLVGGVKSGAESMMSSVMSYLATGTVGASDKEIEQASPEARQALLKAREQINKEKPELYRKAEQLAEASAETSEQYGLAKSLQDVDSPIRLLNYGVNSFGEQVPQYAQGILTLGMGTYIQEKGSMQMEIVNRLMSEGKTLEEALDSDELDAVSTDVSALSVAALDLLGLFTAGATKYVKGLNKLDVLKRVKNPYAKATIGTVGEVVTEVAQEGIAKGGVSAAMGEGFLKGVGELSVDEIKEVAAKTLFGAAPMSTVSAFTRNGEVKQQLLDNATTNPKVRQVMIGVINARKNAGIITEEQAQLQIQELNNSIEANLQIPSDIQGEQREKLVKLQKTYNELAEAKSNASPAFAPNYNERMKNIEEQMQKVASEPKQERTTVEQYGDKKEVKINNAEGLVNKISNNNYSVLDSGLGEVSYNYKTNEGVEVTIKEDNDIVDINGNEVQADVQLDFIGVEKNRGTGLASKELDNILKIIDDNDLSISLLVDSEGATSTFQGNETAKKGLSDSQLKEWYKKRGFIFKENSAYAYRPKKSEDSNLLMPKKYTAKDGELTSENIEEWSSPEDLRESVKSGDINKGFHEAGDDNIYYFDGDR